MSARVLVVDDLPTNLKLLETKLTAEYFDVITATNGFDAITLTEQGLVDIVLLDVMMAGMDGFETCTRLKSLATTAHVPVVLVTALDQPSDRLRGLDAGADDFVTKPFDDTALFARVRSLVRLKAVTDELRMRAAASRDIGIGDPLAAAAAETGQKARSLLVEDREAAAERLAGALGAFHRLDIEPNPHEALIRAAEGDYDLAIVSLDLKDHDGLRLCSQLRSLERTRNIAVLMLAQPDDRPRILRGLEIGVHDYLVRPVDRNELIARVRTQVRRGRFAARLRASVQSSMELAVTDALTGLHNRRYLDTHLQMLFDQAVMRARPLSLMVLDIDRFKSINDTYGHDVGDEVLREFAVRVKSQTRVVDLVARTGGEEIVVVVPETGPDGAMQIAERIRERIEREPFPIYAGTKRVPITVSIGVAGRVAGEETPATLMKRADQALYHAKEQGRNRVVAAAA